VIKVFNEEATSVGKNFDRHLKVLTSSGKRSVACGFRFHKKVGAFHGVAACCRPI
jgi:hypothetical protein